MPEAPTHPPSMEATLGKGRRLLLFEERLEWHPGAGEPLRAELSGLREVRLERRPVWEALVFTALGAVGAALVPWLSLRVPLALLGVLGVFACLVQRRYALVMEGKGIRAAPLLAIGRPGSPVAQRVASVWESLRQELSVRNVRCGP